MAESRIPPSLEIGGRESHSSYLRDRCESHSYLRPAGDDRVFYGYQQFIGFIRSNCQRFETDESVEEKKKKKKKVGFKWIHKEQRVDCTKSGPLVDHKVDDDLVNPS